MVLFINACVRAESRTLQLAKAQLARISDDYIEIKLVDVTFPKIDESFLTKRDSLIANKKFDDDLFAMARQFAVADTIVIAAPYWDLSFPAMVKQYLEFINVVGITFEYTNDGIPRGLCKANKLYYVMTAGGNFVPEDFGYGYVKTLCQSFYGIKDVELISAIGLDVYGADVSLILNEAVNKIK
ncbi:ACP phosphodiesterase [Pseudobutyrivibrio ruminis]|uniref:ACP phosphodiesterase n=1 Tax=Pseudobutyrivibrio ruminis TaxID=46206 RepID=A0A2G3E9F5_9FIRM|nr:NAD(P)H-dependent oxidoreductase [Pseudobutyrivibrio ruminis]PHU39942.1 ACP phosphodiesterase [Pseudobutyrivibrio ruminis]